jgi:hypothetical protein
VKSLIAAKFARPAGAWQRLQGDERLRQPRDDEQRPLRPVAVVQGEVFVVDDRDVLRVGDGFTITVKIHRSCERKIVRFTFFVRQPLIVC